MMADFGANRDPEAARNVTWAAARFPDSGVPKSKLGSLAEQIVALKPENEIYRRTAAAAMLRAGSAGNASQLLEQNRLDPKADCGLDEALLAIAYHALGRPEEAKAAYHRAATWAKEHANEKRNWADLLELSIIMNEAESLLHEPSAFFPDNVFVR